MFFDLHSDILYDVVKKCLAGKLNPIKDYHLKQYHEGEFIGGIWTYYTDINNPLCEFNMALDYILEALEETKDVVNIIKNRGDYDYYKLNVLLGFEGLAPVKDPEELETLYNLGFRHAMLTWNEQNHFATGVSGDDNRGLTDKGKELVSYMNERNMIIDISHANIKTALDIINLSQKPVIASHSNIYNLCPNKRNISDECIEKLMEKDGLIGITAVRPFVNPQKPTVAEMVKHIEYLRQKDYLDHIGLGFDFMDYLDTKNLDDLLIPKDAENIIKALDNLFYSEIEIDQITYLNALNFINNNI